MGNRQLKEWALIHITSRTLYIVQSCCGRTSAGGIFPRSHLCVAWTKLHSESEQSLTNDQWAGLSVPKQIVGRNLQWRKYSAHSTQKALTVCLLVALPPMFVFAKLLEYLILRFWKSYRNGKINLDLKQCTWWNKKGPSYCFLLLLCWFLLC